MCGVHAFEAGDRSARPGLDNGRLGLVRRQHAHGLQIGQPASRGAERLQRFLVRGRFEDEQDVVVTRCPIGRDERAAEIGDEPVGGLQTIRL
jgi:hypothetical protein